MIANLILHYRAWFSDVRQQALAEAYIPVIRGFLLPGALYFFFATWVHARHETGFALVVMVSLSLVTAINYLFLLQYLRKTRTIQLPRLEFLGAWINLLMYSNGVIYMQLHFEEDKLVYFALLAVVSATTGVTLRITLASVALGIGTMVVIAYRHLPSDPFQQNAFIGVATAFVSLGMATRVRNAILRQIDARLAADEMAQLDSLTGIPNRRAVFNRMEALEREGQPFWIGILDLDGFKSINDIYGHAVGDALLCEVVGRLQKHASPRISFGRIGGDEFAIIIADDLPGDEVERVGATVIADVSAPYRVSLLHLVISGTIGFARYPDMGRTIRETYEKADFALYRGKNHARGRTIVFTLHEDKEMREGLAFEKGLREADIEKELYLLFQPQMNVIEHRVVGFEALARWQSPALGPVRPDRFIRSAERAGLIQNVTRVLFAKGLDALSTWPEDVSMSFNISAQDVGDRAFIFSLVSDVLERDISPARIELEITETAVMKDIGAARALLSDLSEFGFRIALDDFGSGYSSFEYIDQLPLDKVKLDKSFVRRVPHSAASREIIAGIIALCRNLNLRCVLEGVETEAEMAILKPLGPEIIQGFLFGRPMDNASALALIEKTNARRVAS